MYCLLPISEGCCRQVETKNSCVLIMMWVCVSIKCVYIGLRHTQSKCLCIHINIRIYLPQVWYNYERLSQVQRKFHDSCSEASSDFSCLDRHVKKSSILYMNQLNQEPHSYWIVLMNRKPITNKQMVSQKKRFSNISILPYDGAAGVWRLFASAGSPSIGKVPKNIEISWNATLQTKFTITV